MQTSKLWFFVCKLRSSIGMAGSCGCYSQDDPPFIVDPSSSGHQQQSQTAHYLRCTVFRIIFLIQTSCEKSSIFSHLLQRFPATGYESLRSSYCSDIVRMFCFVPVMCESCVMYRWRYIIFVNKYPGHCIMIVIRKALASTCWKVTLLTVVVYRAARFSMGRLVELWSNWIDLHCCRASNILGYSRGGIIARFEICF